MKTTNRELSEISGTDLAISEQKLLKGGNPAYPYCYCFYEGSLVNWGLCGIGTALECKNTLEQLNPGWDCHCYEPEV